MRLDRIAAFVSALANRGWLPNSSSTKLIATAIVALAASGVAKANLIVNGDFETGSLASWTVAQNGTNDVIQTVPVPWFGAGTVATDGSFMAAFNTGQTNPGGTLSQVFATSAGTQYTVQYSVGASGGPEDLMASVVGNNGITVLASQTGSTLGNQAALTPYTFTFTADGNQATLRFLDDPNNSTFNVDPVLDNVSVTPEPNSLGLLSLGGLFLLPRRRSAFLSNTAMTTS